VIDLTGALQQLVKAVDETMVRFRQPTYFVEPVFHISIAENRIVADEAQEPMNHSKEGVDSLEQDEDSDEAEEEEDEDEDEEGDERHDPFCVVPVRTVHCNIGNRHFKFDLKAEAVGDAGGRSKAARREFVELIRKKTTK
jgi:hypothetical protein